MSTPMRRRLLLIFGLTILAPGVVLGFLGIKALIQQSRLAGQEVHERLNVAAENVGRRIESELQNWQEAVDDIARSGANDPSRWPERVRNATAEPGAAVVLVGGRGHEKAIPAGQLLYRLSSAEENHGAIKSSVLFEKAEGLELRDKAYDAAVATYRQVLNESRAGDRAAVLSALARSLKKSGRFDDAIKTYRALAKEPAVRIGSLPSDLIALYEIALMQEGSERAGSALQLFEDLVGARWQLEEPSYAFYSEKVHQWLPDTDASRTLADLELRKLTLTQAAAEFLDQPRSVYFETTNAIVSIWSTEPPTAILFGRQFVEDHLFSAANASNLQFSTRTPEGTILSGAAPSRDQVFATYSLQNARLPLQVQVWPKNSDVMFAAVRRQKNFYVGMVAIVLSLLLFGSYFTVRTLKSELAVAQMKSDFVSTVSHEFRSPLAGINQLAEMLRDDRVPDDARRHEYYEMIVGETRRLRRLVENILDFSRMEEGRKQFRFEPLEPSRWLEELTEDFQAQVASSGFSIESSIPPQLPRILADRETLTTAVHNLLDNAVKYSPTERTVRLQAGADRETVCISVSDRGIGIRDEDRSRIFEKFYRGGGELSRQVQGVGLGLNLVQHIVFAHGGTIDFESKEGEGSTFTIRLNYDTHIAC